MHRVPTLMPSSFSSVPKSIRSNVSKLKRNKQQQKKVTPCVDWFSLLLTRLESTYFPLHLSYTSDNSTFTICFVTNKNKCWCASSCKSPNMVVIKLKKRREYQDMRYGQQETTKTNKKQQRSYCELGRRHLPFYA